MGIGSLLAHKLRTLLTMLGMIFGVGAVVAMLSITEGARQEMIRYIDLLGVNNIVVEAIEAPDRDTLIEVRQVSQGLTFRDARAISANTPNIANLSERKTFQPTSLLPSMDGDLPTLIGVRPNYTAIYSMSLIEGALLHRGGAGAVGAGVRARGAREDQRARLRLRRGQVHQGQRRLAPRHRGDRAAGDRGVGGRGTGGGRPQQRHPGAAELGHAPVRGQQQLPQGRDRRDLPSRRAGLRPDRDLADRTGHPEHDPQRRQRLLRARAPPTCSPSASSSSSCSRSS